MREIKWKPVTGYEGIYEVSNYGDVRNAKRGNVRKTKIDKHGYITIELHNGGHRRVVLVHRLVARAFPEICGEWFEGCQINHKDENKTNNLAENLEVCDCYYNINYGTGNNRRKKTMTEKVGRPVLQYSVSGILIKRWNSMKEASRELNINHGNIYSVCCGKNKHKSAGGYIWKYADGGNG